MNPIFQRLLFAREKVLAALLCFTAFIAIAAPQTINPGELWPDDRGKHIQAHGGGILKVGDTYYWFGEERA